MTVRDGSVHFEIQLADVKLNECALPLPDPAIPLCRLQQAPHGQYEAVLSTMDIYKGGDGTKVAAQQLSVLLARASAFLNARVFPERYMGEELPLPPDGQTDQTSYGVTASRGISIDLAPSELRAVEKTELKNLIRLSSLSHGPYDFVLVVFRTAVTQPEALGRFMLLYQCLLQIEGDQQNAIEEQIRHLRPRVPLFPNPRKAGTEETVFTKLRNEVSHPRTGVSVNETLDGIERNVDEFRTLVHESLLEKIIKPMLIL